MRPPKPRHTALAVLLQHNIGVKFKEYHQDTEDILVLIGKGMHWSAEIDAQARDLADKITEEFKQSNPYT